MRILLDEQIDWRLGRFLTEHEVMHVDDLGWKEKKNGELLALAQESFEVLVTSDKNIPSQQKMEKFAIGMVILRAYSNSLLDHQRLLPFLLEAVVEVQAHEIIVVYQNESLRRKDLREGRLQDWEYYLLED
jgi:predicted nuclease of predicted toxin-antitoxin system